MSLEAYQLPSLSYPQWNIESLGLAEKAAWTAAKFQDLKTLAQEVGSKRLFGQEVSEIATGALVGGVTRIVAKGALAGSGSWVAGVGAGALAGAAVEYSKQVRTNYKEQVLSAEAVTLKLKLLERAQCLKPTDSKKIATAALRGGLGAVVGLEIADFLHDKISLTQVLAVLPKVHLENPLSGVFVPKVAFADELSNPFIQDSDPISKKPNAFLLPYFDQMSQLEVVPQEVHNFDLGSPDTSSDMVELNKKWARNELVRKIFLQNGYGIDQIGSILSDSQYEKYYQNFLSQDPELVNAKLEELLNQVQGKSSSLKGMAAAEWARTVMWERYGVDNFDPFNGVFEDPATGEIHHATLFEMWSGENPDAYEHEVQLIMQKIIDDSVEANGGANYFLAVEPGSPSTDYLCLHLTSPDASYAEVDKRVKYVTRPKEYYSWLLNGGFNILSPQSRLPGA